MAPSAKDKLAALEDRRAKVNAEIRRIKAQESKKQRQEDTRRKILIGSAVLARVKSGEWPEDKMLEMLDRYLTKERDRALFDLSPASGCGTE